MLAMHACKHVFAIVVSGCRDELPHNHTHTHAHIRTQAAINAFTRSAHIPTDTHSYTSTLMYV